MKRTLFMQAMAVSFPVDTPDSHPNKHPFRGVMTRLDTPSDAPVGGADKRRVVLPTAVAEAALPTLLGMAVDFTEKFDGHDTQQKIGVITGAVIEAGAIVIDGYFYKKDFPEQVAKIVAEQDKMGWSYEMEAAVDEETAADQLTVTECYFTGAAVLYAAKAAYTTTTLTANADETEIVMNEELKALLESLGAKIDGLNTKIDGVEGRMVKLEAAADLSLEAGNVLAKVSTHTANLRAAADALETDGYGMDESRGHVKILRSMADEMESDAAKGKLPHAYSTSSYYYASAETPAAVPAAAPVEAAAPATLEAAAAPVADPRDEELAALRTEVEQLKGKSFQAAAEPERKTLPPSVMALLARGGIDLQASGDSKIDVHALDTALAGLPREKRIEVKQRLMMDGKL